MQSPKTFEYTRTWDHQSAWSTAQHSNHLIHYVQVIENGNNVSLSELPNKV
jgi:hypothetical protein